MDSSKKSNKIREIVRLQQLIKKWRKQASSSKSNINTNTNSNNNNNNNNNNGGGGSGNKSIKFLKRTLSLSERGSGGEASSNAAVPKGFLAVCVGEEQRRFTIPTEYLGHQAFHILLREAEEEFGFQQAGILRIPCDVSMFEAVVRIVEEKRDDFRYGLDDFVGCYPSDSPLSQSHHPLSPMCR